ncbi:MAG TPA: metalloprotease TldD [Paenalcaligenes sp.]|nr:metalloprotease TldD [Paenalcaligenes sp.]
MIGIKTNTDAYSLAQATLLEPWALQPHHLEQALADIHQHRVDYADLYFQYSRSENWSLEEGIVKTGRYSLSQGVGVRALSGEKTAFSYADTLSPAALLEAAHVVRAIARQGGQQQVGLHAPTQVRPLYTPTDPVASLDATAKVHLLEHVEALARQADPRIVQVMAGLGAEHDIIYVVGSDGRQVADVRPLIRLSLTVIAEQNGRREVGTAGGGGRYELGYFDEEILKQYVEQAVGQALLNLESKPAPAGVMPVVLGPGWPGVLLHEAVGHGLEGDFNRKGSSVFSGRMGEQVTARGITVIDDGTIENRRGSLSVDDEGNTTERTVLIEDGILKNYLQDSLNARLMGMRSTGNARRESYAHVPMPRMTNTFMLAGDKEPEEIIASVERGIYAVNFGGGQVDITSGKFVFSASEAWLIENGRLSHPIKGATLIGSGIEAMNQVKMIGNDLALDTGVGNCGKEGQVVPVGVGLPTLRIDGLTVGGTQA